MTKSQALLMANLPLRIRNPKYGWIPDLPDKRDYLYKVIAPSVVPLPSSIDLRPKCGPVENQGELGACTAFALTGNSSFWKTKIVLVNCFCITTND